MGGERGLTGPFGGRDLKPPPTKARPSGSCEVSALALGQLAVALAVPDSLAARVADGELGRHEAASELLAAPGLQRT